MSLPPTTVHIKRKATDEPVDFLRVHESSNGKRQRRATDFVFSRQPSQLIANSPGNPVVRRIKQPIPRAGSSQSLDIKNSQASISHGESPGQGGNQPDTVTLPSTNKSAAQQTSIQSSSSNIPRRFHITRNVHSEEPNSSTSTKRKASQAIVFSERKSLVKRSRSVTPTAEVSAYSPAIVQPSRPQKKPGLHGRDPKASPKKALVAPSTPTFNVRVPSGAVMPWDVDSERLAAEMQAYTLQEIGRSLAAASISPEKSASPSRITTPSKFKPKAPKLRYHERHPEEASVVGQRMILDEPDTTDDEDMDSSEYIIDTYIRMPADTMIADLDEDNNIGLLVLDGEEDIVEFYKENLDEDEDDEEEDEDENAENHYSADYPDEEVESDDEFGRNPYNYRKNHFEDPEDNNSDDDDDDDAAFSDDDGARYPWKEKLHFTTQGF